MIEFRYPFSLATRDEGQLAVELRALNMIPQLVILGTAGGVVIQSSIELTSAEFTAIKQVIAAHVPDPEFAAKREIAAAVTALLNSPDPAIRGQVNVTRVIATRLNDVAQLLAKVLAWAQTQPGFPLPTQAESALIESITSTPRLSEVMIVKAASEIMFLEQTGQLGQLEQPPPPMPPGNG